jgi:hypothetical protein
MRSFPLFAWSEAELQVRLMLRRPDLAHVHIDDREPTAVSGSTQPLEDLLGA